MLFVIVVQLAGSVLCVPGVIAYSTVATPVAALPPWSLTLPLNAYVAPLKISPSSPGPLIVTTGAPRSTPTLNSFVTFFVALRSLLLPSYTIILYV